MAIVAAQWLVVPPPQQRRPVVTEGAVVEAFVPFSRGGQHRTILESWRTDPQPQQRLRRVTSDTPSVFIPKARDYDRVLTDAWHVDPVPQRRRPTVTAGAPLFLAPRIDATNHRIVVASWRHIPAPQRSTPTAILPAEVFPDPSTDTRRQVALEVVAAFWRPDRQPQQRPARVTEAVVVVEGVPFVRERVVVGLWKPLPVPQQRPARAATLPAEVFPDPPLQAQARRHERVLLESWQTIPQPTQRRRYVTESGAIIPEVFVPKSRVNDRVILAAWQAIVLPVPQRSRPTAILPTTVPVIPTRGFLARHFLS